MSSVSNQRPFHEQFRVVPSSKILLAGVINNSLKALVRVISVERQHNNDALLRVLSSVKTKLDNYYESDEITKMILEIINPNSVNSSRVENKQTQKSIPTASKTTKTAEQLFDDLLAVGMMKEAIQQIGKVPADRKQACIDKFKACDKTFAESARGYEQLFEELLNLNSQCLTKPIIPSEVDGLLNSAAFHDVVNYIKSQLARSNQQTTQQQNPSRTTTNVQYVSKPTTQQVSTQQNVSQTNQIDDQIKLSVMIVELLNSFLKMMETLKLSNPDNATSILNNLKHSLNKYYILDDNVKALLNQIKAILEPSHVENKSESTVVNAKSRTEIIDELLKSNMADKAWEEACKLTENKQKLDYFIRIHPLKTKFREEGALYHNLLMELFKLNNICLNADKQGKTVDFRHLHELIRSNKILDALKFFPSSSTQAEQKEADATASSTTTTNNGSSSNAQQPSNTNSKQAEQKEANAIVQSTTTTNNGSSSNAQQSSNTTQTDTQSTSRQNKQINKTDLQYLIKLFSGFDNIFLKMNGLHQSELSPTVEQLLKSYIKLMETQKLSNPFAIFNLIVLQFVIDLIYIPDDNVKSLINQIYAITKPSHVENKEESKNKEMQTKIHPQEWLSHIQGKPPLDDMEEAHYHLMFHLIRLNTLCLEAKKEGRAINFSEMDSLIKSNNVLKALMCLYKI